MSNTKDGQDSVKICYKHIDKFTEIYADGHEVNKMPDNINLTVFCQAKDDEGFLIDLKSNELGIEALIAKKWIIHADLEKLAGCKIL